MHGVSGTGGVPHVRMRSVILAGACLLVWHGDGVSGAPCDSLTHEQTRVFERVQRGFRLEECAGASLQEAPRDPDTCAIARHLSAFACWLAAHDKDSATISAKLEERRKSFVSAQHHDIDCSLFAYAGDPEAPVTVSVYISIGCPLCKTVCALLHDSVTAGSLHGKARLCAKLLSNTDNDMALLAAEECGSFWEYMKALARIERRLDMSVLVDAAEALGMPAKKFKKHIDSPSLRARAAASREEALRNGVTSTPTIFINGRRYHSYYTPVWLVDAIAYEYEQKRTTPPASAR